MALQQKSRGTIFMSSCGLILNNFLGWNSISILQCSPETDDVESAIFDDLKYATTRISFLNVKVCFGSEMGHIVELKKKQFQCQKTWNNWCIRSTDVLAKCFMALDSSKSFFKNPPSKDWNTLILSFSTPQKGWIVQY